MLILIYRQKKISSLSAPQRGNQLTFCALETQFEGFIKYIIYLKTIWYWGFDGWEYIVPQKLGETLYGALRTAFSEILLVYASHVSALISESISWPLHPSTSLGANTRDASFLLFPSFLQPLYAVLDEPEVTANLYCNFAVLLERLRDLQYIFAVTSGSPSITRGGTIGGSEIREIYLYRCKPLKQGQAFRWIGVIDT